MEGNNAKPKAVQKSLKDEHLRLLFWLCILLRALVAFFAFLASYLPAFDSSASILLQDASQSFSKRWIATSFRWDAFHYLHVADQFYKFEFEWAFFPGVPLIFRVCDWVLSFVPYTPHSPYTMLFGQYFLSALLTPATARTLYDLTMLHTGSQNSALLSACMFLLPSSPATLTLAPYAEPWFAFFSYKGMLYCAQERWLLASGFLTLAGMFRANGVFLGGFIVWGMIVKPLIAQRWMTLSRTFLCMILSLMPALPFIGLQACGYMKFCTITSASVPSWCTRHVPLIYNHVQSHYWNVGFLRYWTLQQLPNFLLAAPPLLLLGHSSFTHIMCVLPAMLHPSGKVQGGSYRPLMAASILPHAIHAFIITCILLFSSHIQIILRLASSMPFTYWSAARLFDEHPNLARAWIAWSVVWGAVSIALWTAFLPPA